MGLLSRRRLPAERRPRLEDGERIVAWAGLADQGVVVVTNRGLWLPDEAPGPAGFAGRRLGWHEIHKVTWAGRQLTVVAATEVTRTDGYRVMADLPPVGYPLLDPDRVPEQVRQRVNRSVAYTVHHELAHGGVRVVARRVSGVDGLRWTVRYDEGTDPEDPDVAERTAELVAQARASLAAPDTDG